jgi:hypothetical protein
VRSAHALAPSIGLALALLLTGGARGAVASSNPWITIETPSIHVDYGNLPAHIAQTPVGRLRLDHIARVTTTIVHGQRVRGDLLVISGDYRDIDASPSNWIEGTAFYIGTNPTLCALKTCGPGMPPGVWYTMGSLFPAPLVDYPSKSLLQGGQSVAFRIVLRLSSNPSKPNLKVRDLSDLWLLREYNIYFSSLPFERSQLLNLSSYFGYKTIPTA